MSLWEYANPAKFMALSARILPALTIASCCLLLVGLFWGFFLTPSDYKQGSTVKIIFLHVPSALMAINAWLMMLVASLIWLIRRHHVSALASKAAAPIGITMTLIAIATEYIAIVWGDVTEEEGTITGNIGRSLRDRLQMAVFEDESEGKHAVTHYKVVQRFGYVTVVSCKLETGRTHQIRVHMKHLGHPLFNDERYGGDKILKGTSFSKYKQFIFNCFKACPRHALHAQSLGFVHPSSGENMIFQKELPEDMLEVIRKFEIYTSASLKNR